MWYQVLSLALVAQVAFGAIHKPGSKFLSKHNQNGSKYPNGRGPYFFNSEQEAGLTSGRKTPVGAAAQDMITEYRFEGPTTSGVTTGCFVTVQPGKRKQTTFFVIDTTGEEQIAIKGSTIRMTFPGPSFFPGLTRTNTVYFHEICFPSQCGSGTCGFVTGPVTSTRTSIDQSPCPPPLTPPANPVPCENGTGSASANPDPPPQPTEGVDTPINPDNTGHPAIEPGAAGSQPANSPSPPRPHSGENPKPAPVNSTKLIEKPDPCPDDKNETTKPDPCPDEPETPSKNPKPSPDHPLPVPPRSRPSSSPSATSTAPTKPAPASQPSSTQGEDILSQLQKLLGMTQQPQRAPSSGNNFLVSTASETQMETQVATTDDLQKTTAEEAEVYYSGLPGAVRGRTGAIYYPSCSASAYRQVAITPFCDTRRVRNRRKNVFSELIPDEDLQLFGL